MPNPVEELALPLRGKKRGITKNNLLGYYGKEHLGLNDRTIDTELQKIGVALSGFWDLIDASFLSEPKKAAYRDLLDQRIERLGL